MTNIILPDEAVAILQDWQNDGAQIACADIDEIIGLLLDGNTALPCDDAQRLDYLRRLHTIRKEISTFIPRKGGEA